MHPRNALIVTILGANKRTEHPLGTHRLELLVLGRFRRKLEVLREQRHGTLDPHDD